MKRQHKTTLIVEDDQNDQLLIRRALEKLEVPDTLHILSNGDDAIAYLNGEGKYADRERFRFPSFVLTDLKMCPVDGLSVIRHVKSNPEWAVVPTIVLSASSDTDDIKKSYIAGANSYLIKPNEFSELQSLLKKLYDYWISVEVPQVEESGKMQETQSRGKLGERFSQPRKASS